MRAGDAVEVLLSLHGEIFVHGRGLLLLCRHVLEGVDLLLGQVQSPALVLH